MTERTLRFRSEDRRYAVELHPSSVVALRKLGLAAGSRETGGILGGYYSADGRTAIVTKVSPPPADSRAGRLFFDRGTDGLMAWLDGLWVAEPRQYYVGEWHVHLATAAHPSGQDDYQMRTIGGNPRFCCPTPIMVIVAAGTKPLPTLAAFLYESGSRLALLPVGRGEAGEITGPTV